ncbi:hypothetical protein GYMLUDRAFT_49388 [Collybiopsis luxurians FD-317 M1]|uniref:Uncharacterized protein n=1 Tax=Collybiopsis luxurians FD-317 M1 TaxID=944289 RepID=A0A0D0CEI1_9AGAR|nr:hypothetical protein GYMLUDRAFT_49388 [Collybiopsis luxurians FD-317 M1]
MPNCVNSMFYYSSCGLHHPNPLRAWNNPIMLPCNRLLQDTIKNRDNLKSGDLPILNHPFGAPVLPEHHIQLEDLQCKANLHISSSPMYSACHSATSVYSPSSGAIIHQKNHIQLPAGISSGYVNEHGWLCSDQGQLILWLPPWMRGGFRDKHQILTMAANADNCALSVDWSNFVHGTQWTNCWDLT